MNRIVIFTIIAAFSAGGLLVYYFSPTDFDKILECEGDQECLRKAAQIKENCEDYQVIVRSQGLTLVTNISSTENECIIYEEVVETGYSVNCTYPLGSEFDTCEGSLYDYEKFILIAMPRAVSASVNHIVTNGTGLDDASFRLDELMFSGTLYSVSEPLMENSTFPDWITKINAATTQKNFETNITILGMHVKPFDSFHISLASNFTLNITDVNGRFAIVKNFTLETPVSIEGFEDPIYALMTLGKVINFIDKSDNIGNYTQSIGSGENSSGYFYGETVIFPLVQSASIAAVPDKNLKVLVTDGVTGIESTVNNFGAVVTESGISGGITIVYVDNFNGAMSVIKNHTYVLVDGDNGEIWDIEGLRVDVNESRYSPSAVGGSFLDRLEGSLLVQSKYSSQTTNIIGLESFVDKDELSLQGLIVDLEDTNVDYLYFANASYTTNKIKGTSSSFRIDSEIDLGGQTHVQIYNVTDLLE